MFGLFAERVGPEPPPENDDPEGLVLGLVTLGLLAISLPALFHVIGACVLSGAAMRRRISRWWVDTQDRRLEAELAGAVAVVLAAVVTASLRLLFDCP